MRRHAWRLTATLLCALAAAGCGGGGDASGDDAGLTLAVIPKGTTHEYWKAVHAGAEKAEHEIEAEGTPVELIWKGPVKEDDRSTQIRVVETFITRGVDGIVLAPLDAEALVNPVEQADQYGIPTVVVDSALNSETRVSFVATNNRKGGRLAGRRMVKKLDGEGRVVMLRYQAGSASTHEREEGFLETVRAAEGIEVISANQYGGATTESAMKASQNLMSKLRAADGIFCPNESTTFGMLRALEEEGIAGEPVFIGFDSSERLIEGLRSEALDGLVLQDPFKMGRLGVRTLVDHIRGEAVPERIDTGVRLVTPGNMDQPENQRLLHPPVDKWLN